MTKIWIFCQSSGRHGTTQKELSRLSSVQLKLCLGYRKIDSWCGKMPYSYRTWLADEEVGRIHMNVEETGLAFLCPLPQLGRTMKQWPTLLKKWRVKWEKRKEGQTASLPLALSRLYKSSDGIYFLYLQVTRVCVLPLPISFYLHERTRWDNRGPWQSTGQSLTTANKRSIASRLLMGRGE